MRVRRSIRSHRLYFVAWNENIDVTHAQSFPIGKSWKILKEYFLCFTSFLKNPKMGKQSKCSDLNLNDAGSLFFWGLIVLLFVLVIGNFILTLTIISFFKIGMGMESIKLIPELKTIKFYGITDFNKIYKKDGIIESYRDSPVVIECKFLLHEIPKKTFSIYQFFSWQ